MVYQVREDAPDRTRPVNADPCSQTGIENDSVYFDYPIVTTQPLRKLPYTSQAIQIENLRLETHTIFKCLSHAWLLFLRSVCVIDHILRELRDCRFRLYRRACGWDDQQVFMLCASVQEVVDEALAYREA